VAPNGGGRCALVLLPRGHLQRGHVELEHEVGEAIEKVPAQSSSRSERNHWLRFRYVSIHPIVGAYLMIYRCLSGLCMIRAFRGAAIEFGARGD
jgi:hypothetical protein